MMRYTGRSIAFILALVACNPCAEATAEKMESFTKTAIFAGGCFWCMQGPFDRLDGVISTRAGYIGGHTKFPTYQEVSAGITGHAEAVTVTYDPSKIGYEKLLDVFWHNIDPTARNSQFCDHGMQYRSAIFYTDDKQKALAFASLEELKKTKPFAGDIHTQIVKADTFYEAEDYHQDYYKKNRLRYKYYRFGCGRDARLKELWGQSDHE